MRKHIILASASPRRIELLHKIQIDAEVMISHKPERVASSDPQTVVSCLSRQKAQDIARQADKDAVVIGADTVVAIDGKILGKPKTHEEAFQMISELAGRYHHVFTGVSICHDGRTETFVESTRVHVAEMTQAEIHEYAESDEPMDKAGGYGIQGTFAKYITGIEGDYYNVVGLPLAQLYQTLKQIGGLEK